MTAPHAPVSIRPGRPEDAPALYRMHIDALKERSVGITVYADPRSVRWLERRLAEAVPTIAVAEEDGCPLGYIDTVATPDSFHFNYMVVSPAAREKGVGRSLFAHAEQWGRERGFDTLSTDVFLVDQRIIERYQRLGYRIVRTMTHVRLSIPSVAPGPATFCLDPADLAAAQASVEDHGFGRVTASRGEERLEIGLIGDTICRLMDRGALTMEEAVAEVRALFAGQRELLILLFAESHPTCDGMLSAHEAVRLRKPIV